MLSTGSLMALAALLFVKHLIADGPLQTRYQLANKGTFGHPGGLLHAGVHVAMTAACLLLWALFLTGDVAIWERAGYVFSLILGMEFVLHYCADWFKCQADGRFQWSSMVACPDGVSRLQINSSMFFIAFLADQTIHSLTYVWIVYLVGASF